MRRSGRCLRALRGRRGGRSRARRMPVDARHAPGARAADGHRCPTRLVALVDRVRRSHADCAGGGGAREQSRPAGRDGPHRPCPCQRAVRIFEPVPECRPRRRRSPQPQQPGRCPAAADRARSGQQRLLRRTLRVLRGRPVGALPERHRCGAKRAAGDRVRTADGPHDGGRRDGPRVLRAACRRCAGRSPAGDAEVTRCDRGAADRPPRRRHHR